MPYTLKITWQPQTAIESLSQLDRRDVDTTLERIRRGDFQGVPEVYKVHGRTGEPDYHVIRANERLRILFTIDAARDEATVRDLVDTRTIRRYG